MITKIKILFSTLFLFTLPVAVMADTAPPAAASLSTIPTTPSSTVLEPLLISQIKQAKQLLETVKLNYALTPHYKTTVQARTKTKKQVLTNYTLDIKDLALAILDPATSQIRITTAMQRDSDFEFPEKNYAIQKVRFNGVNTRFTVSNPPGGKVLALKYLITPTESGSKAQIEKAIYSGIYVPYSPELMDDSLAAQGAAYLDTIIAKVSAELASKPSVSQPGKTIPEAINARMVRALIYAEHMDTSEFLNNPNTSELVKKINVLLGGNEGETWKYSVSTAGAAGISQFIPSTYGSLVKRHTDAKLIPDFVNGMRDHTNAVKATFILLDDYIKAVQDRAPESFLQGHAFDYGVAAYNGGPARVAKAAKQHGATWYEDHSSKLAPLEAKVARQSSVVGTLKSQLAKAKNRTEKTKIQKVLTGEQATLNAYTAERDEMANSILRNETINYVLKIHRLVQIFNDQQPAKLAARN